MSILIIPFFRIRNWGNGEVGQLPTLATIGSWSWGSVLTLSSFSCTCQECFAPEMWGRSSLGLRTPFCRAAQKLPQGQKTAQLLVQLLLGHAGWLWGQFQAYGESQRGMFAFTGTIWKAGCIPARFLYISDRREMGRSFWPEFSEIIFAPLRHPIL